MATSRKKSPTGLLSESAKKAGRGIGDAARMAVGNKRGGKHKSPTGNLSEAATKTGTAVGRAAKSVVGMRSGGRKSGAR